MPTEIYEILSLGMRYWFALLGVLIVWRSFRWLRHDRAEKHRRLKQLPDAGMVGELVVLTGCDQLPSGTALPLPREGVLGRLRTCDVTVPAQGVGSKHLDFVFREGNGLLVFPYPGCTVTVDGEELHHRSKCKNFPLHHGSRITIGEAVLRMRLFVGLETEQHTAVQPESYQEPQGAPDGQAAAIGGGSPGIVYQPLPGGWVDAAGLYHPAALVGADIDPATGMPLTGAPFGVDPQTGYALAPYGYDPSTGAPYVPPELFAAAPQAPGAYTGTPVPYAPYAYPQTPAPVAETTAPETYATPAEALAIPCAGIVTEALRPDPVCPPEPYADAQAAPPVAAAPGAIPFAAGVTYDPGASPDPGTYVPAEEDFAPARAHGPRRSGARRRADG